MYSLETNAYDKMVTRSTLPIRDLAISPDGKWVAVASDELTIKVIDTEDMLNVLYVRDCPKPPKHVAFDPSGSYLSVSCTNGIIYVYSLSTSTPELVDTFDGLIRPLEADSTASSRTVWHPDGRAFAVPTATRDVQVVSREGDKQRTFSGGHGADISALAWAPNGSLLVTAGSDRKINLWDTASQTTLAKYDYSNVINFAWHPTDNSAAFATSDGEIYIYDDFVPTEHISKLRQSLQPAPFIHDPLKDVAGNSRKNLVNGLNKPAEPRKRQATPDSLDDILGSEGGGDLDDFVVDDDNAGYALNENGKRTNGHLVGLDNGVEYKRQAVWQPQVHAPFQSGSTPWRGNRRYLCEYLPADTSEVLADTRQVST
jgi:chromosome transmission fidelity protein 4